MSTLGQKLRELRHQKGYKLNEVAEGAELSISFISLIERDKASISVENLQKLANFYNVHLFQIFQDIEEEEAYVVKEDQIEGWRDFERITKPKLFLLSPKDNLSFKAVLVQLPLAKFQKGLQLQKGETFIFVKQGSIEIMLPNKQPIFLKEGDSAHLTSFKGTSIINRDDFQPSQLVIVASTSTQYVDETGEMHRIQEI
jgi:transcriptional regulator with XRE-family HTH domain